MFKLCDRIDAMLKGEVQPTLWDFILICLDTLVILAALIGILAALIGTVWLAAFVVEVWK